MARAREPYPDPEIVETTLVISRFCFLRVGSPISELRVIILPGTQILKVGSRISDCGRFCFSFLKFYVASSRFNRLGGTRTEKMNVTTIRTLSIYGYQPKKIRRRRYEQKLNENYKYATQSRENKSSFHYLCC